MNDRTDEGTYVQTSGGGIERTAYRADWLVNTLTKERKESETNGKMDGQPSDQTNERTNKKTNEWNKEPTNEQQQQTKERT